MLKKILPIALLTFACLQANAQTAAFTNSLASFMSDINASAPDAAIVGTSWSDAYIGKLVGIPPHFGVGVSTGVTRFDASGLSDAIKETGSTAPSSDLVLPTFAVEARIGGFILPFDMGIRFALLPENLVSAIVRDVSVSYLNFGVDARYAIVEEKLAKPDISIGLGYYHMEGSVGYSFKASELANVSVPSGYDSTEDLDLNFATNVFDVKAQVSKNFLVFTPYAGAGLYYARSSADYRLASVKDSASDSEIGLRCYGGTSINLFAFRTDIGAMYNFLSENWGLNVGMRLQF